MDKITKQESSIPVQSRVSIVTLASLDNYWLGEGKSIQTVSQLVSWSLYLLTEILTSNKMLGTEPSIEEARKYMIDRKLYQRGMDARGYQKLGNAIRFQGMREDGANPQQSTNPTDRAAYNMMHRMPNKFSGKSSSVEPFEGKVENDLVKQGMEILNNIPKNRQSSVLDELSGVTILKERGNSPEVVAEHIKAVDKAANEQLDALNNFDPLTLLKSAKKE
jgi:hypothetical protein